MVWQSSVTWKDTSQLISLKKGTTVNCASYCQLFRYYPSYLLNDSHLCIYKCMCVYIYIYIYIYIYKENSFEPSKKRSRRYPSKTITDANYADDIVILANTPIQAKTLLHTLERATAGIYLHVKAQKTEYMCFNQTGDISTRGGSSLKLVDKFTYLGSCVSSTKKDIDTRLMKAWTAID